MITNLISPTVVPTQPRQAAPLFRVVPTALWTTEQYLEGIESMGERVGVYIQYICQVDDLKGTSTEAKQKAVIAFYQRLATLERQLGRIQEDLKLG